MPRKPSLRPRILLAAPYDAEALLRRALGPLELELFAAHDGDSAMRAVERGIDLVVCTLRFDESRMLDFAARIAHARPHLPVVCCRVLSRLPGASLDAAFAAAGRLGAVEMVNLGRVARREGVPNAEEQLRAAVLAHLHGVGHTSMS